MSHRTKGVRKSTLASLFLPLVSMETKFAGLREVRRKALVYMGTYKMHAHMQKTSKGKDKQLLKTVIFYVIAVYRR